MREWKVVSSEGGATESLINHSCIVIDFLLKGVSQTLNYVPLSVCVRVCALYSSLLRAQSYQLQASTSQSFGTLAGSLLLYSSRIPSVRLQPLSRSFTSPAQTLRRV